MLELFHGSTSKSAPKGTLAFWGQLATAVERAESLFMNKGHYRAFHNGKCLLIDDLKTLQVVGEQTPEEALEDFKNFMTKVNIKSYSLDIKSPLRLVDVWEDDPIGSGALEIIDRYSQRSQTEREELRKLFHPYQTIIYLEDVARLSTAEEIARILEKGKKDPVFMNELEKRKLRSESLGIPFKFAARQEIVWIDLTTKLRTWALEKNYDSFVYQGRHEGQALDSYVTLNDTQVLNEGRKVTFNAEAFMRDVKPIFSKFIAESRPEELGTAIYWAGQNPTEYWM